MKKFPTELSTLKSRLSTLLLCALCGFVFAGCNGLQKQASPTNDAKPKLRERREAVVQDFEQRRIQAQYLAAVSRWQEGELESCRLLLMAVLEIDPTYRQARRLLAEVYVALEQPPEAERQLRQLLAEHETDAEAHHALALLLETSGRPAEAQPHFYRAAELEPSNELYQLTAS